MSAAARRPRILCVDDEPAILEAVRDSLGRVFEVRVADNGPDALAALKRERHSYAVVISDMRMPGMSGATVLRESKRIAPLAVRILLTGYSDADSAIKAVNEGQIFRFLSKPCPSDQLQRVCAAAVGQHRLLSAERRVFEHTQYDTIDALSDLLAADRGVARAAAAVAREAGLDEAREVELAAKLLTWAPGTLSANVAERLPQLASVVDMVHAALMPPDLDAARSTGGEILRFVADLRAAGSEPGSALAALRARAGTCDPRLLDAFGRALDA
jgi:response regulator RpfG family c-di-GMP phosphodiesterase